MKINQKLIPASNTKTRPGIKMDPEYITIHETDNTNRGADDQAHADLQYNGNSRQASWHFTVDEDSIYQSLPINEVAWHAGDGNGTGNMKSIAIEICVNSDGNFNKAVENAAWLTKSLMVEQNILASKVVQHNHWSGKDCPHNLRSGAKGVDWNGFLNLLKDETKVEQQSDYIGHSFEVSIRKAIAKKAINGYDEKTFKPDDPVTRGQLAAILDRLRLLD